MSHGRASLTVLVGFGLVTVAACFETPTESPRIDAVAQLGKGGGATPDPQAADPDLIPPGIQLQVRVLGSGFDRNSTVDWLLDGAETNDIETNATSYVSDSELIADITVQPDLTLQSYDIAVTSGRGKRGVGTDLLTVDPEAPHPGGGPSESFPVSITYSACGSEPGNRIFTGECDAGNPLPFIDGQNGVEATIGAQGGVWFSIKKKRNEDPTRTLCLDLSESNHVDFKPGEVDPAPAEIFPGIVCPPFTNQMFWRADDNIFGLYPMGLTPLSADGTCPQGETCSMLSGGWIVWEEKTKGQTPWYRLKFSCLERQQTAIGCTNRRDDGRIAHGYLITRIADDEWVIETYPGYFPELWRYPEGELWAFFDLPFTATIKLLP
jgi:hypothetical protein